MLQSPYATLILLWLIFAVVHSGLASGVVMRSVGAKLGKYYRPFYSLVVLVVLVLLIHHHFSAIDTILWRPHWFFKIIAAILILAGFAAIIISLWKHLFAYSGISGLLGIETDSGFEQDGLHKYVRHPMYAGVLLFVWGVFIGYPYENNLISAVCFTVYFFVGIYFLEKKLVMEYVDAYKEYQTRVSLIFSFKK